MTKGCEAAIGVWGNGTGCHAGTGSGLRCFFTPFRRLVRLEPDLTPKNGVKKHRLVRLLILGSLEREICLILQQYLLD